MFAYEIDPSCQQTPEQIRAYYSTAKIGDHACYRWTFGGLLNFQIMTIARGIERGAIIAAHAPAYGGTRWWVKSGKKVGQLRDRRTL